MAKIYSVIDQGMKAALDGTRTEIIPGMPPGVFAFQEQWVESVPFSVPGHSTSCRIRGRFDIAVRLDDGTFGIPDLKTASVKDAYIGLYVRQLRAYAYAVEHPSPAGPLLHELRGAGLACHDQRMEVRNRSRRQCGQEGRRQHSHVYLMFV